MIPPKHPRQPKGALDDVIAFGGKTDQEAPNALQPTPPPLPKKMIIRANSEPLSKDLQRILSVWFSLALPLKLRKFLNSNFLASNFSQLD